MGELKILIHLPKCGGTTIAANLENRLEDRFFHYISKAHDPILQHHIETGFRDIDVMMIHNPKFPYDRIPAEIEADYLAVCREPLSAAVSMYNFATNARHTRNYDKVRGLNFWQFYAFTNKINMWRPNFQTYYMCNKWHLAALEAFLDRHAVRLFPMARMAEAYSSLTGAELDPTLDRNRSPNYHKLEHALTSPTFAVENTSKMITIDDLAEEELRLLADLFDVDLELWRRANAA